MIVGCADSRVIGQYHSQLTGDELEINRDPLGTLSHSALAPVNLLPGT